MKTKRHAARLRKFAVTAKRGDVEICRCVVMALNEDEALVEGSDELSSKLGVGPFEDTVTYDTEIVDTART